MSLCLCDLCGNPYANLVIKRERLPLREQLTAQIKLAILSQDLKPGQKLPSTREIARRFKIHSNTVSAAYRELSESGWVDIARWKRNLRPKVQARKYD